MISTGSTNNIKARRKIYGIAGALLTLAFPFLLMLGNSDSHLEHAQSLCPFKMLTGFPCPGCGITKSLVYFYEGHLAKSLSYHIFGPFVVLFCIMTIVVLVTELLTGKEYLNDFFYSKKTAYTLAACLGAYHFIRVILFIRSNSWDDIIRQSMWK